MNNFIPILVTALFFTACKSTEEKESDKSIHPDPFTPVAITDKAWHDTDDPAIWYNENDPGSSLILGTDKDEKGSLCVFDLQGKLLHNKTINGLNYPNNVDVEQGVIMANGESIDIAITVERPLFRVRVFRLPDMQSIDNGGIEVFQGETPQRRRWPMGVGIFKDELGKSYLFVSRKEGPADSTYIWQYAINLPNKDSVSLELVRKFGAFSGGGGEIEAIMVDDELGFVYYSDEAFGVRKYYADPRKGNQELGNFGRSEFTEDREGIALWPKSNGQGYIVVSDQGANGFNVFDRVSNKFLGKLKLQAKETDGIEISPKGFNGYFPGGLLITMSDDTTFQFYDLKALEGQWR